MRISFLYDQGVAKYREDGFFANSCFFGVLDGVSAPYSPSHPPTLFDGMSGGEMVARRVEETFVTAHPSYVLEDVVLLANKLVGKAQEQAGLSLSQTDELAGTTFAVAKVTGDKVKVIQAGDCFALWEHTDGVIGMTENQVRRHDTEMNAVIESLQREIAAEKFGITLEEVTPEQKREVLAAMWDQVYPIFKTAKGQDVNNPESPRGFGSLNGQVGLEKMWFCRTLRCEELKTLLLFTDGMVPWEAMKGRSDDEVAREVLVTYREGGLIKLLAVARGIEKRVEAVHYTSAAEATAIAIEF